LEEGWSWGAFLVGTIETAGRGAMDDGIYFPRSSGGYKEKGV